MPELVSTMAGLPNTKCQGVYGSKTARSHSPGCSSISSMATSAAGTLGLMSQSHVMVYGWFIAVYGRWNTRSPRVWHEHQGPCPLMMVIVLWLMASTR